VEADAAVGVATAEDIADASSVAHRPTERTRTTGWGASLTMVLVAGSARRMKSPTMKLSLVVLALLGSACVVAARPAPPPPPRIIAAPEAVAIATQLARSRGLVVDYTLAARLDRHARWHVELGGAGGRDHARVVVDGYSGAILHARLRGPRGEVVQEAPPTGLPPPNGPPPPATPPGGPPTSSPPPPLTPAPTPPPPFEPVP